MPKCDVFLVSLTLNIFLPFLSVAIFDFEQGNVFWIITV